MNRISQKTQDVGYTKRLTPLTTKFGKHNGSVYNVSLDAWEAKLHSRFSNPVNDCNHTHLKNWNEGNFVNFFFP